MAYFIHPYLITFDDTMAYGSHHFLTNFKFQCAARESLLFGKITDNQKDWHGELDDIVMLTRDGYCRNITAVPVGERVAVFMTFEEATLSSLRLCFRVVSNQGKAVTCGYQTIVCVDKGGRGVVELPEVFTQFRHLLTEESVDPSFQECALKGGTLVDSLFPPRLLQMGQSFACAPASESYPRIVEFETDIQRPLQVESSHTLALANRA